MPSQEAHLRQAEHNEAVFSYLAARGQAFADWQIIVLFYAALHYVEAYSAGANVHNASHQSRARLMSVEVFLKAIFVDYAELDRYSRQARYGLVRFRPGIAQRL